MPRNYRRRPELLPGSNGDSILNGIANPTESKSPSRKRFDIFNAVLPGDRLSFRDDYQQFDSDIVSKDAKASATQPSARHPTSSEATAPVSRLHRTKASDTASLIKDTLHYNTIPECVVQFLKTAYVDLGLQSMPGKGRGLCANAPITAGKLIAAEPVTLATLDERQLRQRCSHCGRQRASLQQCSKCKCIRYCSQACQLHDWPDHRAECSVFTSVPHILPNWGRALHRLISNPTRYASTMQALQAMPEFDASTAPLDEVQLYGQVVALTQSLLPNHQQLLPRQLFTMAAQLRINSFGWTDAEHVSFGCAFLPGLALLNHDCSPNCAVVFEQRKAHLRALQPIEAGAELTISYIDLTLPKLWRQQELRGLYQFTCACNVCSNPQLATELRKCAFRCAQKDCTGTVPITLSVDFGAYGLVPESSLLLGTIAASGVCLKCGTSLNLASHDLQHELREAYANLKVAHDLQFKDVEQARIKAQQASEQLHRLVWPTHHLQVDATQLWQTTLLLQLDKGPSLKQAAHLASQLRHHMDQILPPSSPILAVQHYTAAKLILAIRSTLTAEEHLEVTKALRFVQLTQGINSSLYTSLENDLAVCAMANF